LERIPLDQWRVRNDVTEPVHQTSREVEGGETNPAVEVVRWHKATLRRWLLVVADRVVEAAGGEPRRCR
jgi:hypothetical protein